METRARNTFFVLLGVAGLLLKGHYSGPFQETVAGYAGNIAASFAVYFIVSFAVYSLVMYLPSHTRYTTYRKLLTAGVALAVVELFEATNGFGVMTNVYDRVDCAANALGIGLALAVDAVADTISSRE